MIKIKHLGKERELSYWAKYYGIAYAALYARYKKWGNSPTKLFRTYKGINKPVGGSMVEGVTYKSIGGRLFWYQGKEQNLYHWAEELGINYKVLEMRVRRGKSAADLFALPRQWVPKSNYEG
jgi:hypothetical protein